MTRSTRRLALALGLGVLAITLAAPAASAGPKTKLMSKDSTGLQAATESNVPSVSADGKIVAFRTTSNLQSPPDLGTENSVYFRRVPSGKTRLVSRSKSGVNADKGAHVPKMSANGRYIVISTASTNLIDGKTLSGVGSIILHDRVTKKMTLMSVNNSGQQSNGGCFDPDISASGKLIVFECSGSATNMTGKDIHGKDQIYLRNLNSKRTVLISRTNSGQAADGDAATPAISPDGRYVAYESDAANLPGPNPGSHKQVFLRDRKARKTKLISRNGKGKAGNEGSFAAALSNKAKVITFTSRATNLGAKDTNGQADIYRHRRLVGPKGKTDRVSKNWKGRQLAESSAISSLSKDGRYLAFRSPSGNAIKGGIAGGYQQVYRRDLKSGKLILVSRTGAKKGNEDSGDPYITANGKYVVFVSAANNLIPGIDANGHTEDVLRRGPY